MEDIKESLAELCFYKASLFKWKNSKWKKNIVYNSLEFTTFIHTHPKTKLLIHCSYFAHLVLKGCQV